MNEEDELLPVPYQVYETACGTRYTVEWYLHHDQKFCKYLAACQFMQANLWSD